MITTINTEHELYIYMNGVLIYKRWLNTLIKDKLGIKKGYGRMFYEGEGIKEKR